MAAPPLAETDLCVWWVDLQGAAGDLSAYLTLLSEAERDRAARLRTTEGRTAFTVTRGVLRSLLGEFLGCAPDAVELAAGPHGKPQVVAPDKPLLHFNVSHTRDRAVLAFSADGPVGVDVECIDERVDGSRLAARFFSWREITELARLPDARRQQGFFACWTRKEAFVKAVGTGISHGLASFTVNVGPDGPAELSDPEGERWRLVHLHPGPGYAAALAAPRRAAAPRLRESTW